MLIEMVKQKISDRIKFLTYRLKELNPIHRKSIKNTLNEIYILDEIIKYIIIIDEPCEWEYDGVMYDFSPHTDINNNLYKIHSNDDFKYCPYCGKRIGIK